MSRMPPRFKFAKKTLMTAYAMRMMQNSTMIGLVTEPKPPTCVVAKSTKFLNGQLVDDISGNRAGSPRAADGVAKIRLQRYAKLIKA